MKALAIIIVCLGLTGPAQAFGGGSRHGGGFHPAGPPSAGATHPGQFFGSGAHAPAQHPGQFFPGAPIPGIPQADGGGHHHHGGGYDGLDQLLGGGGTVVVPSDTTASAPSAPEVVYQPVPYCPMPAQAKRGPEIIYIGAKPVIHGPKVIYGTN